MKHLKIQNDALNISPTEVFPKKSWQCEGSDSHDSWRPRPLREAVKPQTCVSDSSLILQTRRWFAARGGHSSKNNWSMFVFRIWCCVCLTVIVFNRLFLKRKNENEMGILKRKTEADQTSVEGRRLQVIYGRVWRKLAVNTFCICGKAFQSTTMLSQSDAIGTDVVSDHRGTVIIHNTPKTEPSVNLSLVFCVINHLTSGIVFLLKSNFCFSALASSVLVNSLSQRDYAPRDTELPLQASERSVNPSCESHGRALRLGIHSRNTVMPNVNMTTLLAARLSKHEQHKQFHPIQHDLTWRGHTLQLCYARGCLLHRAPWPACEVLTLRHAQYVLCMRVDCMFTYQVQQTNKLGWWLNA